MKIIGNHRIRAVFYHVIALLFILTSILWYFQWISDKTSFVISACLFFIDYLAELYDPHPDNPGPWFRAHFHRAIDNDEN